MLLKTKLFPLSPSGSDPTLITKTITANGNYSASDDGADGYSDVTVAVASKLASLVDGSITSITAEDLVGVVSIRNNAFRGLSNLVNIEFPDTLTTIGAGAFYECQNLESRIVIPGGNTTIGNYTFYRCFKVPEIVVSEGVSSLGYGAIQECTTITSITLPSTMASIGGNALYGCSALTGITILATTPPTLESVSAFQNTNNCPIYVPAASVEAYKAATNWAALSDRIFAIPSLAFTPYGDGTCYVSGIGTITDTNIVIPSTSLNGDTVIAIGDGAFNDNRNITSVEFSSTIQTIGSVAFSQNTSITSLVIPSNTSLSSIGQRAFQYCTALHSALDLGENLTSIGEGAFYESRNLIGITIRATTPPTLENSNAFYSSTNQYPIYVPATSVDTYKTATNWSALASRIQAIS